MTVSVALPAGCPAYRIVEMPRLTDPHARDAGQAGQPGDPGRAQRVAALVAAYHAGIAGTGDGTIAFGWVRAAAGGPVRVIAAGHALAGSALPGGADADGAGADGAGADAAGGGGGEAQVLLALPGGARATVLPPGGLAALLGRVGCWRAVAGISDGLLVSSGGPGEASGPAGQRPASSAGW
jgi:hypothetical protein